jgi:non-specific serine/threonine protein kinase
MQVVRRALASPETRLLTLTGPPGVGKSRLALAAAAATADRFTGTTLVDLSAVDAADSVLLEISRVLGLAGRSGSAAHRSLVSFLHERGQLLVLDGCEAVRSLGEVVLALLRECPGLRVLATSRARLHVSVEREFAVPPLAMPTMSGADDLARLGAVPAMELLVTLTKLVRPGFGLRTDNADALARICIQMEGLPLALEVAAARLAQFEPAELAVRLRNRRLLLDSRAPRTTRHPTLRSAISWSHDLLNSEERAVFRRLSVFPGSWSLVAAEPVAGEPGIDVLAATESLVDKNLLRSVRRPDGGDGFDMLASLRGYAAEQLVFHHEEAETQRRHRRYYASLATQAEGAFGTPDEPFWWTWLGDEYPNLRTALASGLRDGDLESALPLAAATGWYWYTRGYLGEGLSEVDRLVDLIDTRHLGPEAVSAVPGVLLAAGVLAWSRRDLPRAAGALQQSLDISRGQGDRRRLAITHAFLGHVARAERRYDDAWREHTTASELYQELGNGHGASWAQHDLGLVALERGQTVEAEALLLGAVRRFEAEEDTWACAWARLGLGEAALRRRDWERAGSLLPAALDVFADLGDVPRIVQCVEGLAAVAAAQGTAETAARLLSAATVGRHAGARFVTDVAAERAVAVREDARRSLGPERFARESEAGAALSVRAMVASARSVTVGEQPGESPLTARQRQVARLVAQGGTNRQIARALGITEKTVEMHLSQIMARLQVRSRAQVAAHAIRSRLDAPAGKPPAPPEVPLGDSPVPAAAPEA